MVFILGTNFNEARLVRKTLQSFYGIGPQVCARILARLYIHPTARLGSLNSQTVLDITSALSEMKIENDLRRELREKISRLKDMGTYRGKRHAMGLPVRGQNTQNQISTAKKLNRIERTG